jgi:hypothetical protein
MKSILLALLLSLLPLGAEPPAEPLKVLEQLKGKWKVEGTMMLRGGQPEERKVTATMNGTWTLDGRFLETRGEDAQKQGTLGLFGYDEQEKAYRYWWFNSMGSSSQFTGQWDAAAKTMNWTTTMANGLKTEASHRFPDAQTYEWKLKVSDAGGKVHVLMFVKGVRE